MERTDGMAEKTNRTRGRMDRSGQEQIPKKVLPAVITELVRLHDAAADAQSAFSDAVKAQAEKHGLLAACLNRYVKATAGEKFDEEKKKVEQLVLLFDL